MPVLDLFSYRNRRAADGIPDVYIYDELPEKLKVQIVHIWRDAIGPIYNNPKDWQLIHDIVAREHGIFSLDSASAIDKRCTNYLLKSTSVDEALDLIEASFIYIDRVARDFNDFERRNRGIKLTADAAIKELNERFQRAGMGYQFEGGKLLRVDSDLIHSEIVQPALQYLYEPGFEGPCDEFMKAHTHYRVGETKDAITDANNAFESTLKTICDQRRWSYPKGARASDLLKVVRDHDLLPGYLDNSFDQLAATLKSGLPKVREEEGAHGQGSKPRETPAYVAAYALHLAAAKILFLIEAHKATQQM
ncbi:MAG: hypothetical protein OXF88_22445 [Rhodobacteraceae bacterium]|nr:hypothetical protein [Paracoccaceae bacterium]